MESPANDEADDIEDNRSRRQFLALAGVAGGLAALLAATRGKALKGLLQPSQTSGTQTVRGRDVGTAASVSGGSLLSRIFGGKL